MIRLDIVYPALYWAILFSLTKRKIFMSIEDKLTAYEGI